ncbi:MAG TPA: hypothetical protein VFX12_10850, partial [Vicinamibacterales bacterium]|nr:hypothetical protein [Vicinamibacterales bacterium]
SLLFVGFMAAVAFLLVGGLGWPAWGLWKWRGGWRGAAAIPAVIEGFTLVRIMAGVAIDPTSHNLWPFELAIAGVASVAIMAGLAVARWTVRPKGPRTA